ncbi:uncharacterized protein LOC112511712 [Cynara cardunculus var. scolymus]|uniref:uncharacterized protein LOC112511712 n=1 Tax=Cynara cardunculus var. scolymus TaxID=59895 RepID=UPI000D6300BB|nr:uncharacterized protein LOC112511712 [Cynara cardunculus var. scolymus]
MIGFRLFEDSIGNCREQIQKTLIRTIAERCRAGTIEVFGRNRDRKRLQFTGKRRRVLAVEGRKITGDVAMQLLKVVIKERSIVAVACATFLSSMAMVWVA